MKKTTPKTLHTSGPWSIGERNDSCVRDDAGQIIADCSATGRPRMQECANARLICAAPLLLIAARMARIALQDCIDRGLATAPGHVLAMQMLDSALYDQEKAA